VRAPVLALTAALCFAVARVVVRRGLVSSTPLTAVTVSLVFTGGFLWILAALTAPLGLLASREVWPFVLSGLVAPGLGRLLVYVGVGRVGAARASALSATAPLFAMLVAVLALGERPGGGLVAGAACIVAGSVALSWEERRQRTWRVRDLAFPLLGALGFALRDNISRWGLRAFPHPAIAAVVATSTSMALIAGVGAARRSEIRSDRTGLAWLALSGLSEAFASLALWGALAAGDVSVVSPLIHAQPIFTVVLAGIFLRDLERVTWRVGLGAVAIVAGATAVVRGGLR
jgi:drug/metabolite transporter (DMT)-like permease